MSKNPGGFFLPTITVDRQSASPLYKQLYEALKKEILRGTLKKALRLPSTRYLAAELQISRNIVVIAFEQLLAEGYLQARVGAGTFVTSTLPEEVLQIETQPNGDRRLSARGTIIRKVSGSGPALDLKLRYAPFRFRFAGTERMPWNVRTCR